MAKSSSAIVDQARAYLAASTDEERARLRTDLDRYEGDFDNVVQALRPDPPKGPPTGLQKGRAWQSPRFADKYAGRPFTLYVPEDYDAQTARGLIIFLHGGGRGGGMDLGAKVWADYGAEDLFRDSGRIVALPTAPPNEKSFARWNLPEVDEYIADLIEELEHHYRIDPHNVILAGSSMGGIGAIHLAHRMADRFASVLASSSAWDFAFWPCLQGLPFWTLQGVNDANLFRRRHGTDIEFTRLAQMRLAQAGVEHYCREHCGSHHMADGQYIFREWLAWCADRRRDPFYPHVVAATPRGQTPWMDFHRHKRPLAAAQNRIDFHEIPPAPHARWVTIDGVGEETILMDMVHMADCRDEVEEDWNEFHIDLKRKHVHGAVVEVVRVDEHTIEASPRNATGFTLWLHPRMVDLERVRVLFRGQTVFEGSVRPSLATLLDSYLRRRDWGLLYPAQVRIQGDESWASRDQLQLARV